MPKTRQQKEQTVEVLTDKLKRAKSVVFADYKGLNMAQLSKLRDLLREQQAEFLVTKNSLLERALNQANLPLTDDIKSGPTATLFAFGDEVSPLKNLVQALKEAAVGSVKSGIFNDNLLDSTSVIRLSTLPTKDQLRAQVVGSLSSPLYGIVGVLSANLRNLVYTLDQIRLQRGGENN